jgi:hypothetical protein
MSQKSFYFDDYSIVGFEGLKRNDFNLNPLSIQNSCNKIMKANDDSNVLKPKSS